MARAAKQKSGKALNEVQSKQLLKAYGIAGPRRRWPAAPTEAVAIAKRIGYPVVAKGVSAALPHKSEAGAVMVGLDSAKAVRAAYAADRRRRSPGTAAARRSRACSSPSRSPTASSWCSAPTAIRRSGR